MFLFYSLYKVFETNNDKMLSVGAEGILKAQRADQRIFMDKEFTAAAFVFT